MTDRVSLIFDDGSKIDFNSEDEALTHLANSTTDGVVHLRNERDDKVALTRAQIDKRIRESTDQSPEG